VAVVNEAGDVFHRRLNEGGVHVLPSIGADDRPDANELLLGKTYKGKIQAAALGSHGARCPNGAACSTGRNRAGTQHRCGHRGMECSTHPTP
jgi:hypothetical protein